ncbi:MAG: Spy/CpxP family protein refolding chaperone [Spirochaetes bacterium]|nr:Spy/CpxP family protein refolding chaperone [Spirochaetota bacterium]
MKKTALLIFSVFLASAALNAQHKMKQNGAESKNCPMSAKEMKNDDPGCMPPFFLESDKMKKELSLTDDQVTKIKTLNADFKKQAEPIHEKQKALHQEMRKLDEDEKSTISDYEKIIKEMSANRSDIQLLHVKHRIEVRNILTKEQKDKIKSKLDKMKSGRKMKKQHSHDSED